MVEDCFIFIFKFQSSLEFSFRSEFKFLHKNFNENHKFLLNASINFIQSAGNTIRIMHLPRDHELQVFTDTLRNLGLRNFPETSFSCVEDLKQYKLYVYEYPLSGLRRSEKTQVYVHCYMLYQRQLPSLEYGKQLFTYVNSYICIDKRKQY